MATLENPSSSASSRSTASNTVDSYIGSLISLTSKSEIRYEGVLYNINTDESSIGLKHVRSFGTEGRKKDGLQVPQSDKVYEYILFRGSDIKDLQVKSSSPFQSIPAINNDPAIIQSHYPRPFSTSNSLPVAANGPSLDAISNLPQMALPGSNFQDGLPLYQPGGNLGSWAAASPTPNAGGSGLAMPMYWQGYYPPPNGLPHMPQQSLLQPPLGLQMPTMQQPIPIPYPAFNTSFPTVSNFPGSLPEGPSLFPPSGSSFSTTSSSSVSLPSNDATIAPVTLPSTITPIPSTTPSSDALLNSMLHKVQPSPLPLAGAYPNFMSLPPLINTTPTNILAPPMTTKLNPIPDPTLQFQSSSQPASSIMGKSDSDNGESANVSLQTSPTPSLITPGHLLQSGSFVIPSSQHLQSAQKDVEVVQVSPSSPKPSASVNADAQSPILRLPPQARPIDKRGSPFQSRYGYRGRDRGRGARVQNSNPVTKFTKDFDFMAMNEKFKKDEVWGHLGKISKHPSKDKDSDGDLSEEESFHDDGNELSKIDNKYVYNKDDFFDSLSCNALDRDSQNGRTKFFEQMKLETETFGDFSRYRGGQFGRGMNRGGSHTRGSYGRGYSYGRERGRGRGTYARTL